VDGGNDAVRSSVVRLVQSEPAHFSRIAHRARRSSATGRIRARLDLNESGPRALCPRDRFETCDDRSSPAWSSTADRDNADSSAAKLSVAQKVHLTVGLVVVSLASVHVLLSR
jgi:hypothetical protein